MLLERKSSNPNKGRYYKVSARNSRCRCRSEVGLFLLVLIFLSFQGISFLLFPWVIVSQHLHRKLITMTHNQPTLPLTLLLLTLLRRQYWFEIPRLSVKKRFQEMRERAKMTIPTTTTRTLRSEERETCGDRQTRRRGMETCTCCFWIVFFPKSLMSREERRESDLGGGVLKSFGWQNKEWKLRFWNNS
jgi:NADH:ubiquinone oxidoreductase subunit 3 (subunit A)